ncbi:hypothetical protein GQ42DRAFT_163327 [Ramicandelaber brevisporus]|nr:hypothetical protein GQ42DRAFT_163327 [Ramicandelaber brevisporus]
MGFGDQLSSVALMIGFMQVVQHFELQDAKNRKMLLNFFIASTLTNLVVLLIIRQLIRKRNDTTPLEYTEPAFGGQPERRVSTTVGKHDEDEVAKCQGSVVFMCVAAYLLYHFAGYVQPLTMMLIFPLKNVIELKSVKIYVLGKAAEGDLARPWLAANPFGGAQQPAAAQDGQQDDSDAESSSDPDPMDDASSDESSSEEESSDEEGAGGDDEKAAEKKKLDNEKPTATSTAVETQ